MKTELLIECIEICVTIANKASKDCDEDRCSDSYALGVHESCIESIKRYLKQYKEERNGQDGDL